jgi:Cu/Ag efflux protein CusF
MKDCTKPQAHRIFFSAITVMGIILFSGLLGCGSSKPAQQPAEGPKRYHLSGRVVSLDAAKQQVTIDAADIPGFMMAMTMGYSVKNPDLLTPLSPEDQITADVVVNGNDVYLENIVVVKKADKAKAPAANDSHSAPTQPAK